MPLALPVSFKAFALTLRAIRAPRPHPPTSGASQLGWPLGSGHGHGQTRARADWLGGKGSAGSLSARSARFKWFDLADRLGVQIALISSPIL